MTERKDNSGAIWRNERKETPQHPDFTGQALIAGTHYWVSAWKRDADAKPNSPALRFSFRVKDEAPKAEPQHGDPDDDIPF